MLQESFTYYSLTYLSSPDGIFAVVESTNHGFQLHYVHTDNLGSWDIITDMGGSLEQSLSFDAWGNRRNASTWNGLANDTPMFDRGFTGHEHLYNFGLVNMNGRVYDPYMSTFLSPDNYIQCPDNSQNFNRYAYCLNNPLRYTDSSGEEFMVAAIIIGGAIWGAYNGGALANGGNYDISQWVWNDDTLFGVIGGAFVGGLSAGAGFIVAEAGFAFCGTASIAASSLVYSSGMWAIGNVAGFDYDISISLGVVSYNLTKGEFGYLFKKGNSIWDNIGYGLGAVVNACDFYRFATWQVLPKQKRFNKLEKWATNHYGENNLKYEPDMGTQYGAYNPQNDQIQLSDLALSQDYGWAKSTYLHERNHRLEMYPIKNQINNLSCLSRNGNQEAATALKKIYNASDAHSYELELQYAAKNGLSLSQFQDIRKNYIIYSSKNGYPVNKYNYTLWHYLKSLLLP